MYCPRPGQTKKTTNTTTPGKKTVGSPPLRNESCNTASSTVVTDPSTGSSTTTVTSTVVVPGAPGLNGLSWFYRGEWGSGASYQTADPASTDNNKRIYDVVTHNGQTYVCIEDHTSDATSEPQLDSFVGTTFWTTYWMLVAKKGDGSLTGTDKTFFDQLKDDVFDWISNASLSDLLLAGAGVAGVIWAGSKIVEAMLDSGSGDGNADSRWSGTMGYVTTSYIAPDIKQVIGALCDYGNIPYDASTLPAASCEFTIGDLTSIRSILTSLSQAYLFDMVDTNGILRFTPRQVTAVKTIDRADIGFSTSSPPPTLYTGKKFQGISLPKSVTLTYYDSSLDYNTFTQVAQLFTYPDGQEVTLSVPVTLSAAQAKKVAEVTLINSHLEATTYQFTTSYKHIDLEPGDVVNSPMGLVRITKIEEVDEGILQFTSTDAGGELAVEGSALNATIPPASSNIPLVIGYSQAFYIDPPNLSDSDTGVRLYAAVHGYGVAGWPGADVYESTNGGATYEYVGGTTKEATIGIVAAATPAADYHVVDNTTAISVTLKTGSLASVGDADFWAGKNSCMVGQELIYFKNATLTGTKTYTLSGLLRGRQGSEQFISSHTTNELFVLVDDSLVKMSFQDSERNQTRKYKIVTKYSDVSKATAEDVKCVSNNLLMWTVSNPSITKTGSDFIASWGERPRFNNGIFDGATVGHDSDWGGYGIAVYTDNTYSTIKKTYTTTSSTWTYSSAMQSSDFGAAQAHVYLKIVQLSQKWGPGYPVSVSA